MRALVLIAAVLMVFAVPARAQTPEEIVRWIYLSQSQPGPGEGKGLAHLTAPAQRATFLSQRMIAFHAANDTHGNDLSTACLDFGPDIPGNDFDAAEIARTLAVTVAWDAARQRVTARFLNFGQPAEVSYDFVPESGFWRLDDISGPGYRLSDIPCAPKAMPTAVPGYCYRTDGGQLRLEVGTDGHGRFEMTNWESNGHSCSAGGPVGPIEGGWVYSEVLSGTPCRIEILATPDGSLRLTDRDWACRTALCGARAVIDGITFPASAQVDCAAMPQN